MGTGGREGARKRKNISGEKMHYPPPPPPKEGVKNVFAFQVFLSLFVRMRACVFG